MKDRTIIFGVLLIICTSVGFLGGYQLHEPRVVTETETVTEIETVEVPKVVTETKVEKVKVEDTQVVRDEVYVGNIDVSEMYAVYCEDSNSDGKIDSGRTNHTSALKGVSLEYDEKTESIVAVADGRKYDYFTEPEISKEEFNRVVEKYCGVPPEDNQVQIDRHFGDDDNDGGDDDE